MKKIVQNFIIFNMNKISIQKINTTYFVQILVHVLGVQLCQFEDAPLGEK
jgi:hypothetical protein